MLVLVLQIEDLKRKKREREELGVELLGVQQELAKQQMLLEGIQDKCEQIQNRIPAVKLAVQSNVQ